VNTDDPPKITEIELMALPHETCNRFLVVLVAHPAWKYDMLRHAWTKGDIAGKRPPFHAGPSMQAIRSDPGFAGVVAALESARP
jgi:hypothetical protein